MVASCAKAPPVLGSQIVQRSVVPGRVAEQDVDNAYVRVDDETGTSGSVGSAGTPTGWAGMDEVHHRALPGVRFVAHYALLGRYDFTDIYEAPDAETAHKVSYFSMAAGAAEAEIWHAMPCDRYVEMIEETVGSDVARRDGPTR